MGGSDGDPRGARADGSGGGCAELGCNEVVEEGAGGISDAQGEEGVDAMFVEIDGGSEGGETLHFFTANSQEQDGSEGDEAMHFFTADSREQEEEEVMDNANDDARIRQLEASEMGLRGELGEKLARIREVEASEMGLRGELGEKLTRIRELEASEMGLRKEIEVEVGWRASHIDRLGDINVDLKNQIYALEERGERLSRTNSQLRDRIGQQELTEAELRGELWEKEATLLQLRRENERLQSNWETTEANLRMANASHEQERADSRRRHAELEASFAASEKVWANQCKTSSAMAGDVAFLWGALDELRANEGGLKREIEELKLQLGTETLEGGASRTRVEEEQNIQRAIAQVKHRAEQAIAQEKERAAQVLLATVTDVIIEERQIARLDIKVRVAFAKKGSGIFCAGHIIVQHMDELGIDSPSARILCHNLVNVGRLLGHDDDGDPDVDWNYMLGTPEDQTLFAMLIAVLCRCMSDPTRKLASKYIVEIPDYIMAGAVSEHPCIQKILDAVVEDGDEADNVDDDEDRQLETGNLGRKGPTRATLPDRAKLFDYLQKPVNHDWKNWDTARWDKVARDLRAR